MKVSQRRKGKKKNVYRIEGSKQRAERVAATGIATPSDLKKEHDLGYRDAVSSMAQYLVPFFYAALACALKQHFKFGEERIERVFRGVLENMNGEISVQDMLDRCKRETGLDIIRWTEDNPV